MSPSDEMQARPGELIERRRVLLVALALAGMTAAFSGCKHLGPSGLPRADETPGADAGDSGGDDGY